MQIESCSNHSDTKVDASMMFGPSCWCIPDQSLIERECLAGTNMTASDHRMGVLGRVVSGGSGSAGHGGNCGLARWTDGAIEGARNARSAVKDRCKTRRGTAEVERRRQANELTGRGYGH